MIYERMFKMKNTTHNLASKTEFFPIENLTDKEIEAMLGLPPLDYCVEDKTEHDLERMHAYG